MARIRLKLQAESTPEQALKDNPLLHREYDPLLAEARQR